MTKTTQHVGARLSEQEYRALLMAVERMRTTRAVYIAEAVARRLIGEGFLVVSASELCLERETQ